jgi:hypothetical protein
MSTIKDYSAEEWQAISAAPAAAGLFITLSDASGPLGIAKEALTVGRTIMESASDSAPEIVRTLAESVKSGATRPALPAIPTGNRAQTIEALIALLKTAVRAVEAKSPAEAEPYKTWLASVAGKVAQASKEGGFLGMGGTVVSPDEEEALRQLSEVLDLKTQGAP